MPKENFKLARSEKESTDVQSRGGSARSSEELYENKGSKGAELSSYFSMPTERDELIKVTKQYNIPKQLVMEAYKTVKANRGAAGIDGESLEEFEINFKSKLYKIWNRMSSGSYMPPAVRAVEIPKKDGNIRTLGIPTVADRIAQTVVKNILEPVLEKLFHPHSFGYRPNVSAHDAIECARKNCWKMDWVIDLDIKGFFDNLNHNLMMKALRSHIQENWILIYIERWLKAPLQLTDGSSLKREKGTPQGGVISPLLANLFLHYTFDMWMQKYYPEIKFERYADDIIIHCQTEKQAKLLLLSISNRMNMCYLELHTEKTKIVQIRDRRTYNKVPVKIFDFLGFTFRPREAKTAQGVIFTSVLPGISKDSSKHIREEIRSWKLHLRSQSTIEQLAAYINPIVRGWVQYYGKFFKSSLYAPLRQLEQSLNSWARRKYKTLKRKKTKAGRFLGAIAKGNPMLFAHWQFGVKSYAG